MNISVPPILNSIHPSIRWQEIAHRPWWRSSWNCLAKPGTRYPNQICEHSEWYFKSEQIFFPLLLLSFQLLSEKEVLIDPHHNPLHSLLHLQFRSDRIQLFHLSFHTNFLENCPIWKTSMLSQIFEPWQFPTLTNSPLTAPAWSPCPRAFSSPWKAPSPNSTLRSGATVESAQTRGSGWPTCSPRRPWCEGPPGCLWAGWSGWSWSPRIPWGEPHGSHPRWRKTIERLLKR